MMTGIPTRITRSFLSATLGAALVGGSSSETRAADPITEQEAHAIGVTAYTYFYPLVTMDLTESS